MSTRVRSFCKINLGLAIGPARADGFHALTTCYQTLALHDLVTVSARPAAQTRITLTANHPGVPRTETADAEKNTAFRIIAAALQHLSLTAEVAIDIQKRLPVQGGLGAGSANAVAALIGLEAELARTLPAPARSALPAPARLALAAAIGSDVPLFLLGGTVLGLDRGQQVFPLPDLPATPCVIAVPSVGVSTAQAFRDLDARTPPANPSKDSESLTSGSDVDKLEQLSRALSAVWSASGNDLATGASPQPARSTNEPSPSGISRWTADQVENPLLALVRTGIENDFEEVVFQQHPSLRSTRRDLVGSDSVPEGQRALYAALSGSGSALFGLYRSMADARAAQQRVQASGTQALLTETLPRPEYWRTMLDQRSLE